MSHLFFKEEQEMFRHALRKFLDKEAVPHYEKWEEQRSIPRSFWKKLGDQGYLCAEVEERYGGAEADWAYAVVINEELERVGTGTIGINLHSDIVVPYITAFANEEQKERWLPGCCSGDLISALAMTEPGTGSDLANIKTTAIRDGDHYVLNGAKTFITNGIQSDLILVAVKTDPKATPAHRGISLIMVERDTPGFSRGRKLNKVGLHCQDTAELFFEDCRVPVSNLIGEEGKGFKYMMEKLQQERLLVTISAQVASEEMLKNTIEYVKSREAFGKPVSQFQNTQFKIVEMATEIEMSRAFLDQLNLDHLNRKDIVTKVSMAKYYTTEMAKRVASQCMQLHGGYGYMEEYPIARRFRDVQVSAIYAGTNEIMKVIIAKNMGL